MLYYYSSGEIIEGQYAIRMGPNDGYFVADVDLWLWICDSLLYLRTFSCQKNI